LPRLRNGSSDPGSKLFPRLQFDPPGFIGFEAVVPAAVADGGEEAAHGVVVADVGPVGDFDGVLQLVRDEREHVEGRQGAAESDAKEARAGRGDHQLGAGERNVRRRGDLHIDDHVARLEAFDQLAHRRRSRGGVAEQGARVVGGADVRCGRNRWPIARGPSQKRHDDRPDGVHRFVRCDRRSGRARRRRNVTGRNAA